MPHFRLHLSGVNHFLSEMVIYVCRFPPAVTRLGIKRFQAKIGLDNQISIDMFKKLLFQEVIRAYIPCVRFLMPQNPDLTPILFMSATGVSVQSV